MKNCGESAPHAIIVCAYASELVTDIRLYRFARYTTSMRLPENSEKLTASPAIQHITRVDGVVYFSIRVVRAQTHKTQQSATRNMRWINFGTQASNMVA